LSLWLGLGLLLFEGRCMVKLVCFKNAF
jgi:hypothetical protein